MIPSVKEEVDVFIAGAGPVGMVLALTLRRAGVSVIIVDKAPTTRQHSQAAVLWPRTLDILGLLGIVNDWEGQMAPIHAFDMTIDSTHATLDLQPVPSAHAYPQGVGQDVTERLLDHRLRESGADYHRGVEVVDVVIDESGATTTLRDSEGNTHVVRSNWIVGCEGSRSLVRDKAGIEQVGDKNAGVQLMRADDGDSGPGWFMEQRQP